MSISKILQGLCQYIAEGFSLIFSPVKDDCPAIGVQPFGSALYQKIPLRM
ncbi:isochorismate synthase [Cyanobacterium sp. uoEpiScrs1]|nr:isochorismate synthase [Cyanobacterium sp. uoEpiScrs1]